MKQVHAHTDHLMSQWILFAAMPSVFTCSLSGEVRLHTSGASAVGIVPLASLPGANRRPKRSLHYADACNGALLACGSDGGAVYVFDVEQKTLVDDYDRRHQVGCPIPSTPLVRATRNRQHCADTEQILQLHTLAHVDSCQRKALMKGRLHSRE